MDTNNIVLGICITVATVSVIIAVIATICIARSLKATALSIPIFFKNQLNVAPENEIVTYAEISDRCRDNRFQTNQQGKASEFTETILYATVNKGGGLKDVGGSRSCMDSMADEMVVYAEITNPSKREKDRFFISEVDDTSSALYTKVNKTGASGEMMGLDYPRHQRKFETVEISSTGSSLPIYSQIMRNGKCSESATKLTTELLTRCLKDVHGSNQQQPQCTSVGSDGTIYMDWSTVMNMQKRKEGPFFTNVPSESY